MRVHQGILAIDFSAFAQLKLRRETPIGQDLQDYTRFTGFLYFLNFLRPITRLPNQQALFTTKNPVHPENPVNPVLLASEASP
ncbi:hypothetical protein [Candidatus Thiosymbion oneisti]|uniref:hypothetical protein n=1 Tax=Candidatus Thiosymbion oneisti TaxID=589554 RepID=UPI001A9CB4DC|nr:hypothetical protein [Candidatus Thiosymbion oneisti]